MTTKVSELDKYDPKCVIFEAVRHHAHLHASTQHPLQPTTSPVFQPNSPHSTLHTQTLMIDGKPVTLYEKPQATDGSNKENAVPSLANSRSQAGNQGFSKPTPALANHNHRFTIPITPGATNAERFSQSGGSPVPHPVPYSVHPNPLPAPLFPAYRSDLQIMEPGFALYWQTFIDDAIRHLPGASSGAFLAAISRTYLY